ncbi:MAG TPA: ChbG/HpnK family deacetylase [Acidimicrobiales bacterium]|nr:ChbG/HpnK family deacetylase [Acidimicrobiales bacterium]
MGRVATKLSIVFPMWNEESSIHLAVDAAREATKALEASGDIDGHEIVIVDDASTDATPRMADELHAGDPAHVAVHHHTINQGLGGSIKTGLTHATGDLVLYTDADLPCDLLESLTRATRLMRIYGADIVSAYRHDRTAEGPRRAVYSFAYNSLIRVAFGLRVRDVNFAFKLIRRPLLDDIGDLHSIGSFIDAELLIRAERHGFHTIQFGVDYFPRTRGISTLSSGSTIATILKEMATLRPELARIRRRVTPAAPSTTPAPEPRTTRRQRTPAPAPPGDPIGRRLLIVNADDYGLTEQVSRGILRAHRGGIVTSTSCLVLAPGFDTCGEWLEEEEDLGVGVHLATVGEDPPLLTAAEVPSLVDRQGRLPGSWRMFLARATAGRIDADDLAKEFRAQLEAVRQLGIDITHVDTHQHLHLWPLVRDVVLDLAVEYGIPAVRVPRSTTAFPGAGVNFLANELAKRASARGLLFPDQAAGVDEAGRMDGDRIDVALTRLAASGAAAVELSTHPGEGDDPDRRRYRWNYRWEDELHALTSLSARAAVERHGFTLGTYADLVEARRR